MKKISMIFLLAAAFFLCTIIPAKAIPLWSSDATGELVGSRTSNGGGIYSTGSWGNEGNFMIDWSITQSGNEWTYIYTLDVNDPAVSHFLLEVTEDDEVFNILTGSDPTEGPKEWTKSGNQDLPNPLYGLKFDFGDDSVTYTLVTNSSPVYGVFSAKGGQQLGYSNALYYAGYKTNESLTVTDFIVRPDSVATPIPEPTALLLVASGLISLAGFRRRFKKR